MLPILKYRLKKWYLYCLNNIHVFLYLSRIFKNSFQIAKKLNIDLNLRPQNLSPDTYYKITKEYENLRS